MEIDRRIARFGVLELVHRSPPRDVEALPRRRRARGHYPRAGGGRK
jgi:hypothetical protein